MPRYDASNFDPAAPVATVTLRKPGSDTINSDVVLLIDSGADVTLLPRLAVERIGVGQIADLRYQMMAFDGTKSDAPVADLDMTFLNRTYRGRYVLIDADQGILGRDVLNHVSLLLDGPKLDWSERDA